MLSSSSAPFEDEVVEEEGGRAGRGEPRQMEGDAVEVNSSRRVVGKNTRDARIRRALVIGDVNPILLQIVCPHVSKSVRLLLIKKNMYFSGLVVTTFLLLSEPCGLYEVIK